jgi:hypothetical protein
MSAIGQKPSVAAFIKLPDSSRWRLVMLVLAEYVEARSSRLLGPAIPRMIYWAERREGASKS